MGRMDQKHISRRNWITVATTFGFAIAIVVLIGRNRSEMEAVIRSLGAFGPLAILAIYALLGFSPLPADPLTLVNGAIFGPFYGAVLAWLGTTLAALVEYFLGTRIGEAAEFERRRQALPWRLGDLPVGSVWFLIGGRMLTGAGSKFVSFISGVYRIPLWRYAWTTALTMLFGAVLYALGGFSLLSFL